MKEQSNSNVAVVLDIASGRGLDFVNNSLYITADFKGRTMQTNPADPKGYPAFNKEMIWETDKKSLKCTDSSLKIKCYTTEGNEEKQLGFILMSLRNVHIVPQSKMMQAGPYKWKKLKEVPLEYKDCHPKLYLSLTVKEIEFEKENNESFNDISQTFVAESVTEYPLSEFNSVWQVINEY